MTGEQNIAGLLDTAMEKLNGMVQVNTVVGAPIFAGDTTIIPISKVSLGFVAGGGEYGQKTQPTADPAFGGGSVLPARPGHPGGVFGHDGPGGRDGGHRRLWTAGVRVHHPGIL